MKNIIEYKTIQSEVKDFDKGKREFIQVFTRYDVKDADEDYGRKGMFTKTWSENSDRIKHILNHDVTMPVGKPQKFWDDDSNAYVKSRIGTHKLGDDFIEMVDSGLITEASYGFQIINSRNLKDGGRELLEVRLWEVSSLTGWGANQYTPVISLEKSLKPSGLTLLKSRITAIEKFIKSSNVSDETGGLLIIELKQLQQLFTDLTTEPDSSTLPGSKNDLLDVLKAFNNNLKKAENGNKRISGAA